MSLSVSKHLALVWADSGTQFPPTDVSIRIEETWSPYIQGTLTFPSDNFTEILDPRNGDRLNILLSQEFGEMVHPRDITNGFAPPAIISAYTAAFVPMKPRTITQQYVKPWNAFAASNPISYLTANVGGVISAYTALFRYVYDVTNFLKVAGASTPPPTIFEGSLGIRSIVRNLLEGTTVVSVASDEATLQDYAWTSATPYTPATTDVATLVNYVLSKIGATLATGNSTATYDNTSVKWLPGQNGWDFINPIVQAADLVLYCDEKRDWKLVPAAATSGSLALTDDTNVIRLTSSLDRSKDWFDSCVVEYSWYNGTAQQVAYDIYAPVGSVKTATVKISDTPYPGTGLAYSLTQRALTRAEMFALTAVSDYNARPRQDLTVDITGEPLKSAVISSISWALPADTMSISIRNLVEV